MKKPLLLAGLSLPFIINSVLTAVEKRNNPPPGKMVDVNGEKMHVYTTGHGNDTVVLLSGNAVPSPVVDFSPLIKELSTHYKVAVVEYFGYGWSDKTSKPRNIEAVLGEIRAALKKANVKPPYILMPHSMSGVYSTYYANRYPKEVKAVAGIDPASTSCEKVLGKITRENSAFAKYLSYSGPLGITRIVMNLIPNAFLPDYKKYSYTKKEHFLIKKHSIWNGYNKTVINQNDQLIYEFYKISNMTYPKNLPVIIFSWEGRPPNHKEKQWHELHRLTIKDLDKGKLVFLKGTHYLHHDNSKEMKEHLVKFLK